MSTDITVGAYDTVLSATGLNNYDLTALSATQAIALYRKTATNYLHAQVLDIAGTVVTHAGAEYTVSGFAMNDGSIAALTSTKAIVLMTNGGSQPHAVVLDVTGSTISSGAHYTVEALSDSFPKIVRISDTKALAVWRRTGSIRACVLTVAGTVVTVGTIYEVVSSSMYAPDVALLSATQAIVVYSDSLTVYAEVVDIAGDVLTISNAVATAYTNCNEYLRVVRLTDTKALLILRDDTSFDLASIVLDVSGSTVTAGTPLTNIATDATQDEFDVTAITSTNVMVVYTGFSDSNKAKALVLSGSGTVIGNVNTFGAGTTDAKPQITTLTNAKSLVFHVAASNNAKAIVLQTDPPPAVTMNNGIITLPALASAGYAGGTGIATLPPLGAEAVADHRSNRADISLPMFVVAAQSAALATANLPMFVTEGLATVVIIARLDVTLPALRAEAAATVATTARADVYLPSLSAEALAGALMSAALPMLTAESVASVGPLARADITLPMFVVEALATLGIVGNGDVVLPMLRVVQFANGEIRLPMFQVEGLARAVVTVTYEAYAVNLLSSGRESSANEVTRFDAWNFDQVIRWRNRYYGVKSTGLYLLGGDLDGAAAIAWSLHTGTSNLGSRQMKAVREVFVHGRVGAGLTAQASIGEAADPSYDAIVQAGSNARATRTEFGRGLEAVYWSFGLADPLGGPADIDSMEPDAVELSRKVF